MKHLLVLLLVVGVFIPSASFASLQCTDIFTVREETVNVQPSIIALTQEQQHIIRYNMQKAQAFQMSDSLFATVKTYEDMTFAVKNKIRTANELVDVVIQNIIYVNQNQGQLHPAFQAKLTQMSSDFMNAIAATWRIPDQQITMIIEIRLQNQMNEMQKNYEDAQSRQSYIGFREPTATPNVSSERTSIGFGPRKVKTKEEEIQESLPKPEEAPVEKGPMGFIQFAERSNTPVQPVEPGFIPRKEAPDNFPSFILVINPKTGDLDAINPDAKIGF